MGEGPLTGTWVTLNNCFTTKSHPIAANDFMEAASGSFAFSHLLLPVILGSPRALAAGEKQKRVMAAVPGRGSVFSHTVVILL